MKKILGLLTLSAVMLAAVLVGPASVRAAAPTWNTTGSYVVSFDYLGSLYAHDLNLVQDGVGALTGSGGYPASGPYVYTWVLTSGSVSDNNITFTANYTASADAVTPQTTMIVTGTIALDGSMSGTWTDNYQGGSRAGTWTTTSGHAVPIVTCPAAPSIAGDYMRTPAGGSVKSGSKVWKDVINKVAAQTGNGGQFWANWACGGQGGPFADAAAYAAAVKTFVDALTP